MSVETYEATGATVDEAIANAHAKIPPIPAQADETIASKVVSLGMETGGLVGLRQFRAVVERA